MGKWAVIIQTVTEATFEYVVDADDYDAAVDAGGILHSTDSDDGNVIENVVVGYTIGAAEQTQV